jgi:hypothetical protein
MAVGVCQMRLLSCLSAQYLTELVQLGPFLGAVGDAYLISARCLSFAVLGPHHHLMDTSSQR